VSDVSAGREPIIRFKGVEKAFGDKVIYTGMDLDVYQGETLTIIGGSGTGKSVALKLLIRLLKIDGGQVEAFGYDVDKLDPQGLLEHRRRVAMLFQGAALFDSLTVEQNIKYPLIEHGWKDEDKMNARVSECLGLVGMPDVQKLKPAALSGGMKKRVGLARAIAVKPEVILWDEPTTGLDPINVRRINGLILNMQKQLGVTSIVVTHDMDSAFTVTDRIAFLWDKQIKWCGHKDEAQNSGIPALEEFVRGGRGVLDPELSARIGAF
jgi:phospholipid/cholesterol/gamma-HCH transport system ATP-binding protein